MNFSQKSAVATIVYLLFVLGFSALMIYWKGFERFARSMLTDLNAVFIPLFLLISLRLPFLRRIAPDDRYDEYDRWVAYRAIISAFSTLWAYTVIACAVVVVHWNRQPFAEVPVYSLTLVLLGGAALMALVHSVSVLVLYGRESVDATEDGKI